MKINTTYIYIVTMFLILNNISSGHYITWHHWHNCTNTARTMSEHHTCSLQMTCTFITFDSSHIMLNFLLTSKKLEKAWSILMPSPGDLQAVERNSVWLYLTHGMIDFTVHQSKLFFLFKICKYILQQLMPFRKNKTLQTSVCFYECQHILSIYEQINSKY